MALLWLNVYVLWMIILIGGEPRHVRLGEYVTLEDCEEVREYLILEMGKIYFGDMSTRYYCLPKVAIEVSH